MAKLHFVALRVELTICEFLKISSRVELESVFVGLFWDFGSLAGFTAA